MATRYSGNLRIACLYQDRGDYKCTVTPHGERGKTVYVNPAPAGFGRGVAYDSPQAYDEIAHAAISFAAHDGLDTDGADFSDSGYIVHRTAPHHSPYSTSKKSGGGAHLGCCGGGGAHLKSCKHSGGGANLVKDAGYYAARGSAAAGLDHFLGGGGANLIGGGAAKSSPSAKHHGMASYYSLLIPWEPNPAKRTAWHPNESKGPFAKLSRGVFKTVEAARKWARENLGIGATYTIRKH